MQLLFFKISVYIFLGSVWNDVVAYQAVLSRPMANYDGSLSPVFTSLYLDALDLDMMTTIAIGVFSRKTETNRKLLGVAGIDIRVSTISDIFPRHSLGVFGHAFCINNNGLFLTHPKLLSEQGYLKDPDMVYLDDIEYTRNRADIIYIRKEMINRKYDCTIVDLDWFYLKYSKQRLTYQSFMYCYQPIRKTPFSVAVSIPVIQLYTFTAAESKMAYYFNHGLNSLRSFQNNTSIEILNWLFCNITSKQQANLPSYRRAYPTSNELFNFLNKVRPVIPINCDRKLVLDLLLSASIVVNISSLWSTESDQIKSLYTITSSGYLLSMSSNNKASDPIITRDLNSLDHFTHPVASMRLVKKDIIALSAPMRSWRHSVFLNQQIKDETYITISYPVAITAKRILVGVTGMMVDRDVLNLMLINESLCDGCVSINCSDIETFECNAIDENGYVVISNQGKNYNGKFLGYVNGWLLEKFLDEKIFVKHIFNDTQGQCQEDMYATDTTSGINSLTNTFQNITLMFRIFFKQILQFITILTMINKQYSSSHDAMNLNVTCTKLITVYQRANKTVNLAGTITCSKLCQQSYSVVSMQDTNLILVITTKECGDECSKHVVNAESVKVLDGNVCDRTQKFRKPPPECYGRIEDHGECYSNSYRICNAMIIPSVFIAILYLYSNI